MSRPMRWHSETSGIRPRGQHPRRAVATPHGPIDNGAVNAELSQAAATTSFPDLLATRGVTSVNLEPDGNLVTPPARRIHGTAALSRADQTGRADA
jgi:hypothetical protein